MRIVSKFKDYYDGGAVYGVDMERVYVRERSEITIPSTNNRISYGVVDNDFDLISGGFEVIGFCGELFVMWNFSYKGFGYEWYRHPKEHILFDDEIINFGFRDRDGNKPNSHRFDWDTAKKITISDDDKKLTHKVWSILYNHPKRVERLKNSKTIKELFIKHKTPIFHLKSKGNDKTLIINPMLSDFAFYRMRDTVQAFQEIEMFSSNTLVSDTNVDVPVGGDMVVRDSKGFDKWSFRKEKKV